MFPFELKDNRHSLYAKKYNRNEVKHTHTKQKLREKKAKTKWKYKCKQHVLKIEVKHFQCCGNPKTSER